MTTPLFICNWKMNLLLPEAKTLATSIANLSKSLKNSEIWIAPTTVYATEIFNTAKSISETVRVGTQNCSNELKGAFTGETSPAIAKSCGLTFTLVGHSERRAGFGDTDEFVAKKFNSCLTNTLTPVLCVGETLEERKSGVTEEVVLRQLRSAIASDNISNFLIAYEPVWAIGTGLIPTIEEITKIHDVIRNFLNEKLGISNGTSIRILYGGSANPENISEIMSVKNVDGVLVGGASLEIGKIEKMLTAMEA